MMQVQVLVLVLYSEILNFRLTEGGKAGIIILFRYVLYAIREAQHTIFRLGVPRGKEEAEKGKEDGRKEYRVLGI
jgi:hypothetical protein